MRKERINGVRCEVLNHCLVCFWNFAIIDIATEQNIPDKMGGYQLFCVNKDARTIVFIKKVLISNRNRSRRSFFCVIG